MVAVTPLDAILVNRTAPPERDRLGRREQRALGEVQDPLGDCEVEFCPEMPTREGEDQIEVGSVARPLLGDGAGDVVSAVDEAQRGDLTVLRATARVRITLVIGRVRRGRIVVVVLVARTGRDPTSHERTTAPSGLLGPEPEC